MEMIMLPELVKLNLLNAVDLALDSVTFYISLKYIKILWCQFTQNPPRIKFNTLDTTKRKEINEMKCLWI